MSECLNWVRSGAGIPGDIQYAALWLVRHTRKGPTRCPARRLVAVRVRPGDGPGVIEGWDAERTEWVPYPKLLLLLSETPGSDVASVGAGDRGDDATTPAGGRPVDRAGAEQRRQRETEGQTLAHQLRYHDDYPPLARPLPLHLARLAGQYVLPVAGTKGERSAESGSDER
ncbi:RNaseH domain-containing protein [Streptomyces sp. NPDC088147]|uniref:RNaseH domain-containing protein n=1 Tax=Streptomyces sp. NPDC088147 TaxID=3365830 RepID=UPI00380C79AD